MPFKHNESLCHKFAKPKYRVTNWPEYNDALRWRGDITIWFTEEAINGWHPRKTGARGRPFVYADHAIETAILICQVFHMPLRQTEGFMNSLARLMGAAICIPDFSCISKRANDRQTQEKFLCVDCGYENHADVVGAINVLERGQRLLACGELVQLERSSRSS